MKRIGETNGKMRKKYFRAFNQGKILNNCLEGIDRYAKYDRKTIYIEKF